MIRENSIKEPHNILFSAVGGTDLREREQGPLMYCLKHLEIDEVYLYLTKEIMNSYYNAPEPTTAQRSTDATISFEDNIKLVFPNLTVHPSDHLEVTDPDLFDESYDDFHKEITTIRHDHPDDQLYLNVSSGTPAMKSALHVLHAIGEYNTKAFQVKNPRYFKGDISFDSYFPNGELLVSVESNHLLRLTQVQILRKLLAAYDFEAASDLAKDIYDEESFVYRLVVGAKYQLELNHQEAKNYLDGTEFLLDNNSDGLLLNYLNYLQVLLHRNQIADFARALTPSITHVGLKVLRDKSQLREKDWLKVQSNAVTGQKTFVLNLGGIRASSDLKELFKPVLGSIGPNRHRPVPLNNNNLDYAMKKLPAEGNLEKIQEQWGKVRKFEKIVRNVVAHEIVQFDLKSATDTGSYQPQTVLNILAELAGVGTLDLYKRIVEKVYETIGNESFGERPVDNV
jgi:hypothetical protein